MSIHDAATQPKPLPEGFDGPRSCRLYELAPLLDTTNLVYVLGTPPGQATRLPTVGYSWAHVYSHENLDNIRLIMRDGLVVSSVGIFPGTTRTPRGSISVGGINSFATRPEYRRLGLGEAVLLDAHEKMRANGHHIGLLSTGIEGYYRRYGWESAGRRLQFVLDRGNIGLLPELQGVDLTEDWRPYAQQILELHEREPLVSPRSLELFALLAERKLDRVLVARQKGLTVGYAGARGRAVQDYGGKPEVVAGLVRALFERLDDPKASASTYAPGEDPTFSMTLACPDASDGLPGLLLNRGIPRSLDYIGMVLVLNAPGLFDALDIRDVGLQKRDGGWRLKRGQATLDVTERELVKLVFGPERFPGFAPDIFPIEFYQWPLDSV